MRASRYGGILCLYEFKRVAEIGEAVCRFLISKEKNMTAVRNLPCELEAVFREFRTCEMTTLSKDGTPITWPVEPYYQPDKGQFFVATSIGLAQKWHNVRRNSNMSLLYSNPISSGLADPPAVLVQGNAHASDEIFTSFTGDLEELGRQVASRQPAAELYSNSPLMRYLFDWYYMRLVIYFTPHRILWWDHSDFNLKPHEMEVCHVD